MLRFFRLRRKGNLINLLLFGTFLGFVFIVYSNVDPVETVEWIEQNQAILPIQMDHIRPDYSEVRSGPGESGAAVHLSGDEKELGEKQMKTWFMNVAASDQISMDRSIPDTRSTECKSLEYDLNSLPSASVVIIFTDEAWSPLLRTLHSVVNRSPPQLLKEVILLDDNSKREELGNRLTEYLRRFGSLVRLIRKSERHGLIRAKLAGAKEAVGDVVVFLDSHCEANAGWLEPLLQRIHEKNSAVLCPIIDFISDHNMGYYGMAPQAVGGFWWSLHFKWDAIPERERKRRKRETDPIRSPTMAGGLLAADRNYFLEIGGYDPGMDIWGGENLEISFRVWMCGGSLEFIPCSHVGHIFRAGHPYNMTGSLGPDVHGINSKRLAEVWMDDYKRLFYLHRSDLKQKYVGDLTERKQLRKRLQCQSFKWFLDNISQDKFILDEDVHAFGMIRNPLSNLCLDTLQHDEKTSFNLGVFLCQPGGSSAQVFSLSKKDQLRREESCADAVERRDGVGKATIRLIHCSNDKSAQKYKHTKGEQIIHIASGLCFDVDGLESGNDIQLSTCDSLKQTQKWEFGAYNL